MKFKIYQPTKSAMQSGRRNSKKWLMEVVDENGVRSLNPLMGWVSASDTSSQLKFEFVSKEEAVKFAKSKNFQFEVEEPKVAVLKKKSYAANFTS